MIPKILHYCWFGSKEVPESLLKFIESWKRYCPDYEIMFWNEENCDISGYPFAINALKEKKYAFVADVIRLHVLKEYGGIYLDTDIEMIKNIDELRKNTAFAGFEDEKYINGCVVGSIKNGQWVTEMCNQYKKLQFNIEKIHEITVPTIITKTIMKKKEVFHNEISTIDKYITIYPVDYFYPLDYKTNLLKITKNTFCIHYYNASWVGDDTKKYLLKKQKYRKINNLLYDLLKEFKSKNEFLRYTIKELDIKKIDLLKRLIR